MKYRKFGNTDLRISEIGFGAWAIGGGAKVGDVPIGWGDADDAVSTKAIYSALDAGINFFDTADFYGLGHSEALLGETIGENKDIVIATKVGHRNIDEKIVLDYSKEYIVEACEKSLKRLKRDCLDYYQLHSARLAQLQSGECIDAMEALKQQGKIRYWGLSLNTFYPQAEADYLMEKNYGNGLQLVFNVINQRALTTIEKAAAKGYGIIARMPLQFGLLTGKFSSSTRFEKDDHRSFRLTPEILQKATKILEEKVWPLAEKEGLSKTSHALNYILSFAEISTVIPGIRTAEQVQANTEGIKTLSSEDKAFLRSLAREWEAVVKLMEQRG
ncbi:aldo/keto reductase [Flavisolibacter ginsenosidimutans]|uniref:Aldo/keto reductase n=1 Tax=Flavisolibacter ginsenosidimutans TaxID=661481 RepID=A0A5B8UJG0_9BACT|nr:aldo/keto reductase [Flavisolibacter ginsenosidimutans]QEC56841.1 aldo/keto reductase [Flavisolibacter ginsenosidimutans]